MKKIKIAYSTDGLYAAGGMQRVLTMKANYLAEKLGYDVTIILTEEKELPPFYPLSPLVHVINMDLNFYRMYDSSRLLPRILKYKIYMQRYKKLMTRTLLEIRPDITVSLLRKDINFINSIQDGSRKVGEIHFDKSNYRIFNGPLPAFIRHLISRFWMKQLIRQLKKLDKFIVLTNEDLQSWTELDNTMCIHNPSTFEDMTEHSSSENKQVIAVGRYTYQKGFDLLFRAWKKVAEKHPDWQLQIFGDGERKEYQRQVDELNISNTCILHEATNKIIQKLTGSSIFVLSSRYEGMPMVLGEAMACGVPPVSFACPCGPKDIITDGLDGLLVKKENYEELADKICYLIEQDSIRKNMGQEAIKNIRRFYIENIIQQWDQLFKSLVQ